MASRLGPAKPRAIAWNGAGGCVIVSQDRQLNFLPHMLGHEPLPRDDVECLVDVLANLAEFAAAAAWTRGRRWVNDAPRWQIGGESWPRRRPPHEALHLHNARRPGLRLILSRRRDQLFQLQFQLIKEPLAALGAWPEHLPLHLVDHQLQVFDQSLRAGKLSARLDQCRLERSGIVGKGI